MDYVIFCLMNLNCLIMLNKNYIYITSKIQCEIILSDVLDMHCCQAYCNIFDMQTYKVSLQKNKNVVC